jgi:hypothetical protein
MLAYLDALLDALSVRDPAGVERLLAHPLARILPHAARDEALAIMRGEGDALAAPLRMMQLRHATAELLREAPVVADLSEAEPATVVDGPRERRRSGPTLTRRAPRQVQMELPLSA